MGILIYGRTTLHNGSADGVMPTEENNFLVAITKLMEDYNNTVATRAVLHSLSTFTSQFSTMPKDFEKFKDSVIQISKKINEQKVKNSPLYSHIIDTLWPTFTSKVNAHCSLLFHSNTYSLMI